MHRFVSRTLVYCAGLIMGLAATARCDAPVDLVVSPNVMVIDTFFSGGQVTISGEIPAAYEVAIEVTGPEMDSQFDLKGRVGPFWMTREKVQLTNAPGLYMLLLPQGPGWERKAAALDLGIEHLKAQVSISRTEIPADDIFPMFVKLKSTEGLYSEALGAISYTPGTQGNKRFTASYRFPSSVKAGNYRIKAIGIENGARRFEESGQVTVQQVGFIKMVNDLASGRRLIYGIGAVVLALLAGSLMGVLFKSSGSH